MNGPADPLSVALRVTAALDTLGVLYTIGGSIASSMAGEPRSTVDIHLVAALEEPHIPGLIDMLGVEFYLDPAALERAIRTRGTVNLIHQDTSIKIDLFVAGGTPLDAQQLQRRMRVDIDGRTLFVHPPEDILLQKLRWYRKGGEQSERQWRDILGIVRVQGGRLDRSYLAANAPVLDVADLLERALKP